jgi:transposase
MSSRRKFSREFKLAAVRKVVDLGLSYADVGRELNINANLVSNWRKAFEADGTLTVDTPNAASTEAELRRLRAEVQQLRMERDILKKATAFFANENR